MAVRIEAGENGNGSAEGRDLCQCEINEDHTALDNVYAQVGVNAGQDQAGNERQN